MSEFNIENFIKELEEIGRILSLIVDKKRLIINTIEDSDLCICGSKLTYLSCCKEDISSTFEKYKQLFTERGENYTCSELNKAIGGYIEDNKSKKTPSNRVYHKSLEKKNVKFCLAKNHYGACDDSIVYAHTISRNPILTNLSVNNKLVTFNRHISFPRESVNDYYDDEITVEKASIVNTFCKSHDKEVFKEIENSNHYRGNFIQDLEHALNCISIAVYTDVLQIQHFQTMLKECPELWIENRIFSDYKNHIERLKEDYNTAQLIIYSIKDRKDVLKTFSFVLENYSVPFAICEQKLLYIDAFGNKINEPDFYFFNIYPYINNSTLFILSAINDKLSTTDIFDQLDNMVITNKEKEILSFFAECISENSSNIYFNSDFFNGLNEYEKALIYYYYSKNGALRISNSIEKKFLANKNVDDLKESYKKIIFKGFKF
ncbi:hypothetical protein BCD91_001791 [Clostridium beijerinckii]|uniref:hypothetical protein n=1 Tax=Clostridium beijerinckii TaxID=1520 RepID=UPI001493F2EF|nr:hypothetical protein [Clostridium beijerinckii]NOW89768.1 hypothetical protein [Clostridium beijerinckii]